MSLLQKAKVAKVLLGAKCGADLSAKRLQAELDSDSVVTPEDDLPHFDGDNEKEENEDIDEDVQEDAEESSQTESPSGQISHKIARTHRRRPTSKCRPAPKRSDSVKQKWTKDESEAVHRQLQPFIQMCLVPK